MALIDFDKFLASFITEMKKYSPITSYNIPGCIKKALKDQGFEYKDGEVVRISDESEDEKIRKLLIKHLEQERGSLSNDEAAEAIAWLEKQAEHQKFCDSIQVGDRVTKNEDGVLVNLSQLNRVAKKDEKQGEKKPAWSEEDNMMLECVPDKIGDLGTGVMCKGWLKSLKNRIKGE